MKKLIATVAMAMMLAACSPFQDKLSDGYQPGDLAGGALDSTVQVLIWQQRHCQESDPIARAVLLRLIRIAIPAYPEKGLCTDVLGALGGTGDAVSDAARSDTRDRKELETTE